MTNRFLDLLARRDGPIVADGGMGTMLMAAGLLAVSGVARRRSRLA